MITVRFKKDNLLEEVASFHTTQAFDACCPALEILAEELGMLFEVVKSVKEKTIKEWLQELPEELREKALGYTHEELLDIEISSLRGALYGAFAWEETPEGHTYWCNIKME